MLDIYAGKTAKKIIQQQGFSSDLFSTFLGASGGPKWFSLFGLDKYLFGEFFKYRKNELNLVGSSAGAFRAACFAQNDPVMAISRLAKSYSETVYSEKVTATEISHKARDLLDQLLGKSGVSEIISNPIFKAHFIVAKANGWAGSDKKSKQLLGLTKSYLLNRIDRKLLGSQYERFVFQNPNSGLCIQDEYHFSTQHIDLTQDNLKQALLASGSIPMVMEGIRDIPGAPTGMYRDGGIIDYHFDISLPSSEGLILYPHFNAKPKAGWFDKKLKRSVNPDNYDKTVMLVPSPRFVNSLTYQKIPDREDFTKLEPQQRIKYWKSVLSQTERLAEHFNHFLDHNDLAQIQDL
jgi:hypothetical protein